MYVRLNEKFQVNETFSAPLHIDFYEDSLDCIKNMFPWSLGLLVRLQKQGSGMGHVANNYLRPIALLPKKPSFR